jgi:hypothetical protein
MHTLSVYPKSIPSLEDVQTFVMSLPEGDWVTASRGVIESDDGRVYLDYDNDYGNYFNNYLEPREREQLATRLGFAPSLALHLHVSTHYRHSRELAQLICEMLVKKWGGGWSDE